MKATVIPIGNSRGIRIPKTVLEECNIQNEVTLEVEGDTIVITPLRRKPRKNWERSFQKMHENQDDRLILNDSLDLDVPDWEW